MSEASQEIVPQSPEVTQASEASQPPTEVVTKKPRTPAQVAALDAARQKALAMRAQKKTQPAEESTKPGAAEEGEQEVEYVRKSKSKPKLKKRIVIVEESSSEEEEIEVRLPKRKKESAPVPVRDTALRDTALRDTTFERAYNQFFNI